MNILQKIPDPIPEEMSLADFLTWDAPGPLRWQLVEGVPEAMAPPVFAHAAIQTNLAMLLKTHLNANGPGCLALSNPGVLLSENDQRNYRIPDLGVTCTPHKPSVLFIQNPVLLIEILSPGNARETWLNVPAYLQIASVEEIMVFDSSKIEVENWRRFEDGTWHHKKFQRASDKVLFASMEFSVRLQEIYDGTGLQAGE